MVTIFMVALVLSGGIALGQSTEWHESDHWRIYDVAPAKLWPRVRDHSDRTSGMRWADTVDSKEIRKINKKYCGAK